MKYGLGLLIVVVVFVGAWFGFRSGDNLNDNNQEVVLEDKVEDTKNKTQELTELKLEGDTEYNLDVNNSKLVWEASKITGHDHIGTFSVQEGVLKQVAGELTSGEFIIDMNSITDDDGSEALVSHLKNEDFFNVEKYNTSKIDIKTITKQDDNYLVTADLTILDKTNQVSFVTDFKSLENNIKATSSFEIDRTLWGIEYGSGSVFKNLGDKAIKDEIKFTLDLMFTEITQDLQK